MREMRSAKPTTLDEFQDTGVGQAKLARYGQEFITVINDRIGR